MVASKVCSGISERKKNKDLEPLTASSHGASSDKSASTNSNGYFGSGHKFFSAATFASFLVERTVPLTFKAST